MSGNRLNTDGKTLTDGCVLSYAHHAADASSSGLLCSFLVETFFNLSLRQFLLKAGHTLCCLGLFFSI
jgi:hypothetical protein